MRFDHLTPLQHKVMREGGTEAPFSGEHLHQHQPGSYRCSACDQLLFYSYQKYSSGCGWPAFFASAAGEHVLLRPDPRDPESTEIVCTGCASHLGHVFSRNAGIGEHYCVNSVALRFVPSEECLNADALGASSDDPQRLGLLLLAELVQHPTLQTVADLIQRGADLQASAPTQAGGAAGSTALTWAPTAEITRLLLQSGARPADELPVDGLTSLHRAALAGDLQRISLLIEADSSSLHGFDYLGRTPLACAASEGHVSAVELLLQAGSQIDAWSVDHLGITALMEAVARRQRATVAVLLLHGADPDLALGPNASPREVAEEQGLDWF